MISPEGAGHHPASQMTRNRIVEIPAGCFRMGSAAEKTGYRTVAERLPDPADYPDADPSLLVEGSVFQPTPGPVALNDPGRWWAYVIQANWRDPLGADSANSARQDHPVTHLGYEDAEVFAAWAGKGLPTEVEWSTRLEAGSKARPSRGKAP